MSRRRFVDERGQATVLFALLATVLMGSAALVVDVGRAYILRARADNAMTAAVLAGATQLPAGPAQALTTAQALGGANGFANATYDVACGGTCVVGQVATVQTSVLAQIIGHPSTPVAAAAAAARGQNAVTSYQTPAPGTATAANGYTFFSSLPPDWSEPGAWGTAGSPVGSTGDSGSTQGENTDTDQGNDGAASQADSATAASQPPVAYTYNPYDVGQAGLLPFDVTQTTATGTPLGQTITLKVTAGQASDGNFGCVRIDGPGAAVYERDLIYGASTPVAVGDVLTTQPGNVVGPTIAALQARFANYGNGDPQLAVVPVVTYSSLNGASQVTVVGFAAVVLQAYAGGHGNAGATVTAAFVGAFLPSGDASLPAVDTGVFGGKTYLIPATGLAAPSGG